MALAGRVLGQLASTAVAAGTPASRRLLATAAAAAPGARLAATPPSAAVAASATAAAPKKKAGIAGAIRAALGEAASPLPPGYAVDEEFLHEVRRDEGLSAAALMHCCVPLPPAYFFCHAPVRARPVLFPGAFLLLLWPCPPRVRLVWLPVSMRLTGNAFALSALAKPFLLDFFF